jgi:signal transduction histidine kinase
MDASGFNLVFPKEYLRAALQVSLLSVWVLVGLFYYLNRYTKRNYFTIWTAAWLFYALWLTLNLEMPAAEAGGIVFLFKLWCVAISAVFLLWGSLCFLNIPVRQMSFGLFMLFLLVWTVASPQAVANNKLVIQLPIFILIGLGSIFASVCFFRLRRKMPFVGAGMLSLGFMLWGGYLVFYPFSQKYQDLSSTAFFTAAVLQLFIAVSMIVLVLEEARYNAERVREEIVAVRSEKEALQIKVLTTEEKCRTLYDQVRLTEGLQNAYEELRRTQQLVVRQERLRALGQMASGVAHDINNALSPITAYSELLLTTQPDLPVTVLDYLRVINKSGDDIAHIVARMREFYRPLSDSEPLTRVNLNQIVEEVVVLTRPRWRDVSQHDGIPITVHCALEPGLPQLLSDPSDLREALINLIFNAVDALPTGGTIRLATLSVSRPAAVAGQAGERWLQIEVRDDGVGMDEKTCQRCLEPFFSTKAKRGGTGLGLAMVYGMMQRHEGTIDIESAPGKGTTIRLTFPMRESVAPAADRVVPRPKPGARSLNILCIDDQPQMLRLLGDCLPSFGHRVTISSSGEKGLELFRAAKLKNRPYEMVITDLGLPDIDGHQVAKAIKAESPGMPVIMLTGWGKMIKDNQEALPDVDALVDKPPNLQKLNVLIGQLTRPARPGRWP